VQERWRDAANVVAARWEIFLQAEADGRGFALLLTLPRSTPRRPRQRSWL